MGKKEHWKYIRRKRWKYWIYCQRWEEWGYKESSNLSYDGSVRFGIEARDILWYLLVGLCLIEAKLKWEISIDESLSIFWTQFSKSESILSVRFFKFNCMPKITIVKVKPSLKRKANDDQITIFHQKRKIFSQKKTTDDLKKDGLEPRVDVQIENIPEKLIWMKKVIKNNGNSFNFDRVFYVNQHTKVTVLCTRWFGLESSKKKRRFILNLGTHCWNCMSKKRIAALVEESRKNFGNIYRFEQVTYLPKNKFKVQIFCPELFLSICFKS